MFCMLKEKKIYTDYVSKRNSNLEKQVILLIISNGGKWHYLAVKKLSALLTGIASKNNGDFSCLNCIRLEQKTNLNRIKKHVKIKDFCSIIMPSGETKISELDQYQKYDKAPFIFIQILSAY